MINHLYTFATILVQSQYCYAQSGENCEMSGLDPISSKYECEAASGKVNTPWKSAIQSTSYPRGCFTYNFTSYQTWFYTTWNSYLYDKTPSNRETLLCKCIGRYMIIKDYHFHLIIAL